MIQWVVSIRTIYMKHNITTIIYKLRIGNIIRSSKLYAIWVLFTYFFLNYTSRTHASLMTSFTHFRENCYILSVAIIISYLANLSYLAAIVQTRLESNTWKTHEHPTYKHIFCRNQRGISWLNIHDTNSKKNPTSFH